jgi:CRP-like cAMP-binding protein
MAAKELENKEQYVEMIRLLVPVNELSPQSQNEVINIAKLYNYKKRDIIFKQGDRDAYAYYLLDGEIELLLDKSVHSTLVSGAESAMYAMARLQPRQYSAKAKTDTVIMRINRESLDRLLVADQEQKSDVFSGGSVEVEVADIGAEDSGDWMTKMLQSELFSKLPMANIQQLFVLLEPVEYKKGDTVIKQGDTGDNYYIIQEGRCEVTRAPSPGAKPIKLAELRAGDSFGEEALLTNAKRNASITMLTDGVIMQLSKDNFINLIKKPTLDSVTFQEGKKLAEQGGIWLDVRFPNEYQESHIEGSINMPLNMLRMQTEKLQDGKKYIIYCDTGGRSSAAAFLLTDRGFDVCFLQDGLSSVPQDKLKSVLPQTATVKEKPQEKPGPTPAADKNDAALPGKTIAAGGADSEEDPELEANIRASVIEVDLERTNMDLKEAVKAAMEEDSEKAREAKLAQEKLEAAKKKLEAEKEAAEKEAARMREQEAEKIRKMKEEAERRLAEEKKKLEEIYDRNAREMEKLQRMKQEAEEQIRKEREKLEREAEEARKKNIEADKLKQQLEESRRALEQEAEKKRAEQDAMEQTIQAKAKAKLEAEKRKLAEEFARASEELEKAQRAKAMADAARAAAEKEAKSIISEYKKQFDKERAQEQARLHEERKKLEEQARQIQETLKQIQKSKLDAEASRKEAEDEARRLRDIQKLEETTQDTAIQKKVEEQIKVVEEKLQQAQKNLETVQEAEVTISAAKEVNEQELLRQKEQEELLRKQVESDLAEFKEEEKERAVEPDRVIAQADHIKRIKERAAAAKREAEKATKSLFDDVASQLGRSD